MTGGDGVAEIDPWTRRVTLHRGSGGTDAAVVSGGLAVAGPSGLRMLDTATWRTRRRDRSARAVQASGDMVITSGDGVKARDARTGRVRWRAAGSAQAVAAGRVYAQPKLETVARVSAQPYTLETAGDDILFVERRSSSTGRIIQVSTAGTQRALTPRMPLGDIAYDGETLMFTSGKCVFAGPLPEAVGDTAPADCSAEAPGVGG